MKKHLSKGILGNQSGQTLLEWVGISFLIVVVIVIVVMIIRSKLINKAEAINF